MRVLSPIAYANSQLISTTAFETVAAYNPATSYADDVFVRYGPAGTRVNSCIYSEQFENAAWTVSASAVTANAVAAPDATTTADKLTETATTAGHYIAPTANLSFTSGTNYTVSVFAKAEEKSSLQLVLPATAFGVAVVGAFDLTNKLSSASAGTGVSTSIIALGNGWYRCSLTAQATASIAAQVQIRLANTYSTTAASYLGVLTNGLYIWGAQVETGQYATTYIPTVATAVTAMDYGRIYQSLQGSNSGHQPDLAASAAFWQDYGPVNQAAMFDSQVSTLTTATSPLTVIVKPGAYFDSIAFVGLIGSSINIRVTDGPGGAEIYNQTLSLDGSVIIDWYMYFYEPFDTLDIATFMNIPVYANAVVTATITGTGTVGIGTMLYGTSYFLGLTQYGASAGITDYSVKETDDFGTTKFVKRAFSKRMEAELWMENTAIRFNQKLLSNLRAVPCLWIGVDDATYEPLSVFGYYKDFNIDIAYPEVSMCALEIEGLV